MDDRIRVSDADREEVAARLREHFAEGRITSEELDERITAALSAKTAGDLRRVLADLPGPSPVPQASPAVPWGRPGGGFPVGAFRRGPRLLPLVVFGLIAALVIPGAGWVFFAFFQFLLVLWLAVTVTGIVMAARFRRNLRRTWPSGNGPYWRQYQWHN